MTEAADRKVDVVVIGAGSAGLNARREAERQGAETLLIESGPYGTTCARVGCMPSKLLIAAAERAHHVRGAPLFGLETELSVDGPEVLRRVRRERDRFAGFAADDTEALPAAVRLRGRARFVGATQLRVDGTDGPVHVATGATVIATGSAPAIPEVLAACGDALLTNESIFDLPDLPASLAVIGTGVIGLELGQAMARLGVETTVLGRSSSVGPLSDPAVREAAREAFEEELGLVVGDLRSAQRSSAGVTLRFANADGEWERSFEKVLVAAGRHPRVADLGLETTGARLDDRGVPLHDPTTGRCGDLPIFLAGDVTGTWPVLHEATDEGRIAGYNAAHPGRVRAHRRRAPLAIVFSDPQMAVVGKAYRDLEPASIAIGAVDYGDQGRARVMGVNRGLVRVYADRATQRLIGAEMLGPGVEHTAHLLAWSVQQGLTVEGILEMPFYHPVLEEGIRTAFREAARALGVGPPECARELDCGPGA